MSHRSNHPASKAQPLNRSHRLVLHAAGAALAYKIRNERRVALAFIGDGGTSEGSFYEAINVAGVQKLPAVFLIVNNQWAISVPLGTSQRLERLSS
jgi:pyruvate dehydrogenase E1 component alpha subunit